MKICVPIVNRTNYSKLKPILKALKKESDIEFSIVASSSLILEKYGFGVLRERKSPPLTFFIFSIVIAQFFVFLAELFGWT